MESASSCNSLIDHSLKLLLIGVTKISKTNPVLNTHAPLLGSGPWKVKVVLNWFGWNLPPWLATCYKVTLLLTSLTHIPPPLDKTQFWPSKKSSIVYRLPALHGMAIGDVRITLLTALTVYGHCIQVLCLALFCTSALTSYTTKY